MVGFLLLKLLLPGVVHAQIPVIRNPIVTTPLTPGFGFGFFQQFIGRAIEYGLIIGVVFFLFMLITGAIQWITSGADRGAVEAARERVTQALIGIVVLAGFFAIALLVQDFLGLSILSFHVISVTKTDLGVLSLSPIGQFAPLAGIDLPTLVARLITLGLVVGAIAFIAMLILGAIQWITAGGDKGALESAKQRMTNALLGIFILFGLWVALDVLGALLNINLTTVSLAGYGRVLTFNLMPTGQFETLGGLTLGNMIRTLITLALVVASVVFIFMLIVGGIQYITSGGDKGAIEEARQRITNALIGIFITFCVWVIATLVGYFFGVRLLMFGGIGGAPPGGSVTPLPTNAYSPQPTLPGGTPGPVGTCGWQGPCPGGFNTLNNCNPPNIPMCNGTDSCVCLAPTSTPAPTAPPFPIPPSCNLPCFLFNCSQDGLTCSGLVCRNAGCLNDTDCVCGQTITCTQACNLYGWNPGSCRTGSSSVYPNRQDQGDTYCTNTNPSNPQCWCACLADGTACSNGTQCCSNVCGVGAVCGGVTATPAPPPPATPPTTPVPGSGTCNCASSPIVNNCTSPAIPTCNGPACSCVVYPSNFCQQACWNAYPGNVLAVCASSAPTYHRLPAGDASCSSGQFCFCSGP